MPSVWYLCWVHLALDDVEYRDVAMVGLTLYWRRYHHVLRLKKASHYIENGRLPHTGHLNDITITDVA